MPKIIFQFDNKPQTEIDTTSGSTLMEAAVSENIPGIEGECGGACACGTCHVVVQQDWIDIVGKPDDYEKDMLESLEEYAPNSRLACQINISDNLDGLIVKVPC